jgi:hypothetical protein
VTLNANTTYTVSRIASLTGQIFIFYYDSSDVYKGSSAAWISAFPYSFQLLSTSSKVRFVVRTAADGNITPSIIPTIKFGVMPAGVAGGVVTSHVTIEDDSIEIASGGSLTVTAPTTLAITAGATDATAIAIRNDTDYFLSAGDLTQADAPFWVKKDGSIKASKIQQEYSQSFMDLADATYPAEFPVYIPSGYTVDTVTFSFLTKKYRAYAKSSSSSSELGSTDGPVGGASATGSMSEEKNTGAGSSHRHASGSLEVSGGINVIGYTGYESSHTHSVTDHTHSMDLEHYHYLDSHNHTISLTFGIYEKTDLATSCALKIGATTIGTYSPNPASPVEIKTYLSAGWNTIVVQPNNDARIAGYLLVKLTPS